MTQPYLLNLLCTKCTCSTRKTRTGTGTVPAHLRYRHSVEVLQSIQIVFSLEQYDKFLNLVQIRVLKINLLLLAYERWRLLTRKNQFLDQSVYDRKMRQWVSRRSLITSDRSKFHLGPERSDAAQESGLWSSRGKIFILKYIQHRDSWYILK